jgi:hypothetical protein
MGGGDKLQLVSAGRGRQASGHQRTTPRTSAALSRLAWLASVGRLSMVDGPPSRATPVHVLRSSWNLLKSAFVPEFFGSATSASTLSTGTCTTSTRTRARTGEKQNANVNSGESLRGLERCCARVRGKQRPNSRNNQDHDSVRAGNATHATARRHLGDGLALELFERHHLCLAANLCIRASPTPRNTNCQGRGLLPACEDETGLGLAVPGDRPEPTIQKINATTSNTHAPWQTPCPRRRG